MRDETVTETLSLIDEEKPLPEGWRWVRVGELCDLVNGNAYKPSDWNTSGVPIIRIQNLNNPSKPFNYWSSSLHNKVKVKQGDVLLAWSGTPGTSFGVHLWKGSDGVLNQHIFRVDFTSNEIAPEWFVYAANQHLNILISQAHGGVRLRHVNKREVEALRIPLPPTIEEQRRIASILDEQMKAVEGARLAVEAQLAAANLLPNAFLRSLFESEEAQNWKIEKVGHISSLIVDGPHITPSYVSKGVPFLTVRNIVKRRIDFSSTSFVSENDHQEFMKRGKAERGDILYTKDGTLGIPCVVETDKEFSYFVSVALIKLIREMANPYFVSFAMESPSVIEQVKLLGAGAGLKHMVLRSIRSLEISLPVIEKQKERLMTR